MSESSSSSNSTSLPPGLIRFFIPVQFRNSESDLEDLLGLLKGKTVSATIEWEEEPIVSTAIGRVVGGKPVARSGLIILAELLPGEMDFDDN